MNIFLKRPKYRNKRITHAGYSFASKGEASLFEELKFMEKSGLIYDLKCQDTVYLTYARIIYKPDFSYTDAETLKKEYAEFKGFETPEWRIKLRLWKEYGPGKLKIFKGSYKKIYLEETIAPKISIENILQDYFNRNDISNFVQHIPSDLYIMLQELREKTLFNK